MPPLFTEIASVPPKIAERQGIPPNKIGFRGYMSWRACPTPSPALFCSSVSGSEPCGDEMLFIDLSRRRLLKLQVTPIRSPFGLFRAIVSVICQMLAAKTSQESFKLCDNFSFLLIPENRHRSRSRVLALFLGLCWGCNSGARSVCCSSGAPIKRYEGSKWTRLERRRPLSACWRVE